MHDPLPAPWLSRNPQGTAEYIDGSRWTTRFLNVFRPAESPAGISIQNFVAGVMRRSRYDSNLMSLLCEPPCHFARILADPCRLGGKI